MPTQVDPRMSSPSKYCSYTSTPRRATTTPCGSAPFSSARLGPIAQISFGSSPCCAGGATSHPSDIAAGASQSADVPALATAVRSATQSAADPIQRIQLSSPCDANRESWLRGGDICRTIGETSTFSPVGKPRNLWDFRNRWPEQVRPEAVGGLLGPWRCGVQILTSQSAAVTRIPRVATWAKRLQPGLSRPSTHFEDTDARHKVGHDIPDRDSGSRPG